MKQNIQSYYMRAKRPSPLPKEDGEKGGAFKQLKKSLTLKKNVRLQSYISN